MCTTEDLKKTSDIDLVKSLVRAVELEAKNNGNGKSPFDIPKLKEEILKRMKK